MTAGELGVAVIGADPSGRGFGARAHVPAVLGTPGLRLAAVCTAHEDTARQAARLWRAPRWYADYHEAVADPMVDLVTVSIRVRSHREVVEAGLRAGKPVYCEWPLALDAAEAEPLARLARELSVPAAVGTQGRFAPAVEAARRSVERGDIGRPLSFLATQLLSRFDVHADRWWLAQETEGSGALQVATAHVTDTVQSILGPIASLAGARATLSPADTFADTGEPFEWTAADTVSYTARLPDGSIGGVHVTNLATPPAGFALRIIGEDGQLLLTAPGYVSFAAARLVRAEAGESEFEEVPESASETTLGIPAAHAAANVGRALRAFADAIREGRPFRPSFDDAVALHRLLEAVARSSDDGVWVDLEPG